MTILEKKLDALMRFAAADNDFDVSQRRTEIRMLLCESDPVVIYSARERDVRRVLMDMCAPEHMAGYPFLVDAILLAIEQDTYLDNMTWGIYAPIAVKHSSTLTKVQRGMCNIIEAIWDKAPYAVLEAYFNGIVGPEKDRPTISQFVSRVANVIKYDLVKGAGLRCR